MRFISMVKTAEGGPPSPELMGAIGKLAQDTAQSGVLMELGGLLPSARGARMRLSVRVGSPLLTHVLFPIYVAAFIWGGLLLRDPRLTWLLISRGKTV